MFARRSISWLGHRNSLHGKRRIDIVLEESEVIYHIYGKVFEGQIHVKGSKGSKDSYEISQRSPHPYVAGLETSKRYITSWNNYSLKIL